MLKQAWKKSFPRQPAKHAPPPVHRQKVATFKQPYQRERKNLIEMLAEAEDEPLHLDVPCD